MSIETLLRSRIQKDLKVLDGLERGSESHKATVDEVTKLVDRVIEIEKLAIDSQDKTDSRDEEKKDRLIRNIINVAGIIIPSAITIWGTLKTLEFEKEGTVTTMMGRGFIGKLLPKK